MSRVLTRNALHLAVLSTFAFAQPLFDLLGKTPEFFVVRRSTALDVIVFALVAALVPPALLVAIEALAGLASARALGVVHLVFVAGLAGVVALEVVRHHTGSTVAAFLGSAAIGAAFAALYARTRGPRLFLSVLAPVPLIFLALFFARSPVLKLEGTAKALSIPALQRTPPVVLVVFDEFPIASIMGPDQRVDAVRYPNFAALATTSTWYRNASSVHEHTTEAVPAILTGRYPTAGQLPVAQDHPDNLFTLLGKRYRMNVYESVTQLCPEKLCARHREPFGDRMGSLADDLKVVYGHLVLPKRLEDRLPSVSNTWQDFGGTGHSNVDTATRAPLVVNGSGDIDRAVGRQMWRDQRFIWDRYVNALQPSAQPTLYAMHILLPHYPWRFLPSGKQYGNALGIDGLKADAWDPDPWLVEQGWQRHLFQVGFSDRLLGNLVARLKTERIWDRAMVVAVADHGVSFVPGQHRRSITRGNIADIASVPLFVKLPGQQRGRISDADAQTVDIVPTIADALGLPLPYGVDGRSLLHAVGTRVVDVRGRQGDDVRASQGAVVQARNATVARQLTLFGSGSWTKVFAVGPHRELLGRRVSSLGARAGAARVSIDGESLFRAVDLRSSLSPGHITGRVSGAKGALDLAVAVDGTIAAVTRTFTIDGSTHFAAFVPDTAFRQGANDVQVLAVARDGSLERLHGGAGSTSTYSLGRDVHGQPALREPSGAEIRIEPVALVGLVEDWYFEQGTVRFGGWAGDARDERLVDSVVVFSGKRFVYAGTTTVGRLHLPIRRDRSGLQAGFVFDLPTALVGHGARPLHFYAVRGGVATELPTAKGFPWR